jgi:hypothetical protein
VRRKKNQNNSASLAGWLFADLAIVLAIIFLHGSITVGDVPPVSDPAQTTTTIAEDISTGITDGVSIKPCKIEYLLVPDLTADDQIKSDLIQLIAIQASNCATVKQYGVVLVYAGNADTGDGKAAKARAVSICDSLYRSWAPVINRASTYCQGFKDDGVDSQYFHVTLFPYNPSP